MGISYSKKPISDIDIDTHVLSCSCSEFTLSGECIHLNKLNNISLETISEVVDEIENEEYKVCKSFTNNKSKYLLNEGLSSCTCKAYEFCKTEPKTCKHIKYYSNNHDNFEQLKSTKPNKSKKRKSTVMDTDVGVGVDVDVGVDIGVSPGVSASVTDNKYYEIKSFNNNSKTYFLNKDLTKCSCPSFLYSNGKPCKHLLYYQKEDNKV